MNFLDNVFMQSLAENERNLGFWKDYLNNLNSLNFSVFSDKLTVPILVPIGNKILFRGALKHTNEVTVALGADYFAKCSIKQAEILRKHRIKDAELKVDQYKKEKAFLENQLTFNKNKVYEHPGQDIIETCTEEEDRSWREKHRERVRQYNQSKEKKKEKIENELTDEELWNRLEELELQEELEDEYKSMTNRQDDSDSDDNDSIIVKDEESITYPVFSEESEQKSERNKGNLKENIKTNVTDMEDTKSTKIDLLKQVIDRQKELEVKLTDLKNKDRGRCKTEKDLISKLDEMEHLDELEDEMDRLDEILQENSDDGSEEKPTSLKKCVSFADEDNSETLELSFKHSDQEPNTEPYNPDKGLTKPSDIYEAYHHLFVKETTSIIRKSKYENDRIDEMISNNTISKSSEQKEEVRQTIVVNDVFEKIDCNERSNMQSRPVSLFKKRRLQKL